MTSPLPLLIFAGFLALVSSASLPEIARADPPAAERSRVLQRYQIDPATPLVARVRQTSPSVLKLFEEDGQTTPTPHTLTAQEQQKLAAAFAALPPLHQQILRERLRSISFLDGMPNTALTSTVNPDEPYPVYDITVRAGVLHQNASEWLTEKEQSLFNSDGSPLRVAIEAGTRDALVFVLLHEATHIVDSALGLTDPQPSSKGGTHDTKFTHGVWTDRTTPAAAFRNPLRERIRFRPGGTRLSRDEASAVYAALQQTPFVSLYGSSNRSDDLAEYVAVYDWTQVLKQPYRIVIRREDKSVFIYEPMKSPLVRTRFPLMQRFYKADRTPPG